jgi:predicted RNase H-like HicB family nuclease
MNCCTNRDDDAGVFVGHCPTLDVYSQAETEDGAVEAIKDAVILHLTTAFDFNRLDKVLRRAGFEKFGSAGEPVERSPEREFVRVALHKDSKQHPITLPLRLSVSPQQHPQYASAG